MNVFRLIANTRLLALFCCLLFAAVAMQAQNGSITGTVMDNQGAVVPAAKVVLLDQERAGVRNMESTAEGLFMFGSLPPSTYTVTVEAPGFKKWEKKELHLYPGDRLGVTDIVLQVGQVNETVTVEASVATLQTESAKVEGTVTSQQMTELASMDRSFLNMMRTIPGVNGLSFNDVGGGSMNINGQRNDQMTFMVDGATNMSFGSQTCCVAVPNLDMIQEMKVITNGATADQGQVGASQVMVVTKSGTKEFHGNVYYYRRHESMNANSWTNNITGTAKGRDRMNQGGLTLGGPLYIPKVFNTSKDKLFFFVSAELWKNLTPSITQATVPTQAERNGDFSQSIRMSDKSVPVLLDPNNLVNGVRQPVPNNFIAVSLRNPDALKLMNVMPLPNITDLTGIQYNFRRVNSSAYRDFLKKSYKIDYNFSEKWRFYGRYSRDRNEAGDPRGMGSFEVDNAGNTLGWAITTKDAWNGVLNATTIITPTTTNEIVLAMSKPNTHGIMDKNGYLRKNLNLTYGLPDMSVVQQDYAPTVSLGGGGLQNAPSLGSTFRILQANPDYSITDNFSKVLTRHTFKLGGTFQLDRTDQSRWGGVPTNGAFNFTQDAVNPGDYDYQYATMLTGGFNTFTQSKKDPEGRFVFHQVEWWAMDTWKVTPTLTLDLGMRFSLYRGVSYYDTKGQSVAFSRDLWDPKQTVRLFGYAPGSKAIDTATGLLYPSFMRGQIVPGSGNIDNGFTVVGKGGTAPHLFPDRGVQFSPRIGIAWQPKFLPKTVIRAGGGVFKNRVAGQIGIDSVMAPPTTRNTILRYGNMRDINASLYNMISPPDVSTIGYTGSGKVPTTVNWNFAVERELPSAVLLTTSYIGSISRNLPYATGMNGRILASELLTNMQPAAPATIPPSSSSYRSACPAS